MTIRIIGTVTSAGKKAVYFEMTCVISVIVAVCIAIDSESNTVHGDVLTISSWTAGLIYLGTRCRRGRRRGCRKGRRRGRGRGRRGRSCGVTFAQSDLKFFRIVTLLTLLPLRYEA